MKEIIAVLPGDGVGPEVVGAALEVLLGVAGRLGLELETAEAAIGGAAIDAKGMPLPPETFWLAKKARAILLGTVGGPKWDNLEPANRPEQALLTLRQELGLFANLRPVKTFRSIIGSSPLKGALVEGVDLLIVRELTGGLYYGQPRGLIEESGVRTGYNTMIYNEDQVRRIARVAMESARSRRRSVISVDKASVLETSRLWRQIVTEEAVKYPDVELKHMYVDNCAMQLIIKPNQFDVIVTSNLFGDILSDEAAVLGGSINLLPSASLGPHASLFEPVHGSYPDIAGRDLANPMAAVMSAAMMLRHTFGREDGAAAVEKGVEAVLEKGYLTADISGGAVEPVGTRRMGSLILEESLAVLGDARSRH